MKKKEKLINNKWFKDLIPAYILSFALSFMLFFNEPLIMYTTNKDDFAFDLYTIIMPLIIVSIFILIVLSLLYTGIYFLCKKIFKKKVVFNIILIISFIIFFLLYIQGNYLISNLPHLDGAALRWDGFTKDNIITGIVLLIIIGIYVFSIKKYKIDKVINTSKYVTLAVCAMLLVALISTSITHNIFEDKRVMVYSNNNINNISKNKNFLILLLDQMDSKEFGEELKNSKYKSSFNDFTYYPNTLGAYPYTRDSIPFILTGTWNHNETGFREYVNKAMDNSKLIQDLKQNNYDINIYDHQFRWSTEKVFETKNIIEYTSSMSPVCFAKEELRYISFKYLPYFLKRFSKMDSFDFDYCKMTSTNNSYKWDDSINYQNIVKNDTLTVQDNNYFHFYHVQGSHYPRNVDENLNPISYETDYKTMIKASIKFIDEYINRLKKNNAYDNSVIIIMSDHGFEDGNGLETGRQNPVFLIKGFNEHHDLISSSAPVSYEDLISTYHELINDKKSTDLFKNMDPNRTRNYILYKYLDENHMEECTQSGDAQDKNTIKKTGKTFDR